MNRYCGQVTTKKSQRRTVRLGFKPSFVMAQVVDYETLNTKTPNLIKLTPKGFTVYADLQEGYILYVAYQA